MDSILRVPLNVSLTQEQRLRELQRGFTQVCNALALLVHKTRVGNAFCLVLRAGRFVYQHPLDRFNLKRLGIKPLVCSADSCPVYFDCYRLSVKAGHLPMFALGRHMRFLLALRPQDEALCRDQKLREVLLARRREGICEIAFLLSGASVLQDSGHERISQTSARGAIGDGDIDAYAYAGAVAGGTGEIPKYIKVEEVQ